MADANLGMHVQQQLDYHNILQTACLSQHISKKAHCHKQLSLLEDLFIWQRLHDILDDVASSGYIRVVAAICQVEQFVVLHTLNLQLRLY